MVTLTWLSCCPINSDHPLPSDLTKVFAKARKRQMEIVREVPFLFTRVKCWNLMPGMVIPFDGKSRSLEKWRSFYLKSNFQMQKSAPIWPHCGAVISYMTYLEVEVDRCCRLVLKVTLIKSVIWFRTCCWLVVWETLTPDLCITFAFNLTEARKHGETVGFVTETNCVNMTGHLSMKKRAGKPWDKRMWEWLIQWQQHFIIWYWW